MVFILSVGTSEQLFAVENPLFAGKQLERRLMFVTSDSHWHLDPLKWVDVNKPELTSFSERSPKGEY